ncbi:MAG: autotransporter outer membrane beta-barrel domain-containing protein [Alphaproteobacteria bacterium]|nr:autotransporter outer membrane beta-barrel domain-containing protein [Alphaproteobacteria bacterium]
MGKVSRQPRGVMWKAGSCRRMIDWRRWGQAGSIWALMATCPVFFFSPATPAGAACTNTAPASNEIVNCFFLTDPVTGDGIDLSTPIIAPGSTNVTVNIDDTIPRTDVDNDGVISGGTLNVPGAPAISLGGGSTINLKDAAIADFDFNAIELALAEALQLDFDEVNSQGDFDALFDRLAAISPPLATPSDPTVSFGGTGGIFNAMEGLFLSAGAAGVSVGNNSALTIDFADSAFLMLTANAPAIRIGDASALDVMLTDFTTLFTLFDGSPGIESGNTGAAVSVQLDESSILTAGDDSPGIIAPGASSVFNLEVTATNLEGPALVTHGDNSAGVIANRTNSGSTATIDIVDAVTTEFGPGFQTAGKKSPLFFLDLGNMSSSSFSAANSTFQTRGDESPVIHLKNGDEGDALAFFDGVTASSVGKDSTVISVSSAENNANQNFVATSLTVMAGQDGSAGIFTQSANNSGVMTTFLSETTVTTKGKDAPAYFSVDAGAQKGTNGVDTVTILDSQFNTMGDNSPGIRVAQLNNSSTSTLTLDTVTVETEGDMSPGIEVVGVGSNDSANSIAATGLDITTRGKGSNALVFNAAALDDTVTSASVKSSKIRTEGDNSVGLRTHLGAEDNSTYVFLLESLEATTTGDDANGIEILSGVTPGDATAGRSGSEVRTTTSNVTGARSNALVIGADVIATNPSGAGDAPTDGTAVVNFDSFDGFVATGIRGRSIQNNGTILGGSTGLVLTPGLGLVGNIANNGLIQGTAGTAITYDVTADTADIFELQPMGTVTGTVNAGLGSDTFILGGEGIQTFDQTLIGTQYNGFDIFEKEDGSTWTLSNLSMFPLWEVIEGTLVVQNELIDPIAIGFTVHNGATLRLSNAVPASADVARENRVELQPGGIIFGDVDAGNGSDTFVLGGPGTGAFDHALIGTQFHDFENFLKEDESIWTLFGTDSSRPFLPGTITGGTLVVNTNLSGFTLVNEAGGRLEGTGGVLDLTNGGTFAPGNSIGTFAVAGDLTLLSTGILEVEIAADGTSDLVTVEGDTTLAGTVAVNAINYPTNYPLAQDYVVIRTPNEIAGNFDTITDNLPDVDATVTINQPTGPDDDIPNQDGTVVIGYERGSEQSDKSILPNAVQAGGHSGRLFAGTLLGQASSTPTPAGNEASFAFAAASDTGRRRRGWAALMGSAADMDSTGGVTGYDADTSGIAAGTQFGFDTNGTAAIDAGLGFGYSATNVTNNPSSADIDTWSLGAYGRFHKGPLKLAGAMSYGFQDYTINRVIPLFGATPMNASGKTDGGVFALSAVAYYDIAPRLGLMQAHGLSLSPLIRLDYVNVHRDGYTETGAGILNQAVGSDTWDRTWFGVGVKLVKTIRTQSGATIRPELELRYDHAFGDAQSVTNSVIPVAAGASFTTAGVAEGRDAFSLGAGVSFRISKNVSGRLRYDGTFSGSSSVHRAGAKIGFRF